MIKKSKICLSCGYFIKDMKFIWSTINVCYYCGSFRLRELNKTTEETLRELCAFKTPKEDWVKANFYIRPEKQAAPEGCKYKFERDMVEK